MRRTEVHVVVEDGAVRLGIVEEAMHLRTDHGVHGIIRAKDHHVVLVDLRIVEVQAVLGMVLIEDILGIVALVEECQRQGRLRVGIHRHRLGIHAVLLEEADDAATHTVVTSLADKRCVHTTTAQRNQAVKRAATRNSRHGLVVLEYNVENSLANTYYFSHSLLFFVGCKDTN